MKTISLATLLSLSIVWMGCENGPERLYVAPNTSAKNDTIRNFEADTDSSGHYQFFNFTTGKEVPLSDSSSEKWHIAFRATNIIINSGTSGPGSVMGMIKSASYDAMDTVPTGTFKLDDAPYYAIPQGSGNGWYTYNMDNHLIYPRPGVTLVFKTKEGYAKLKVLSYYKDAPVEPNAADSIHRYYTFVYQYQTNGTTQFN